MVAGKFLSPSTNDKDTIIEAHLNTAGGAIVGTKAVMVRVRKNANNLTASERGRYLFARRQFRNQLGSNYVLFQEMHRLTSTINDQGHGQPAFLPWHRAMLLHVERELQIDPTVALHYWNWDDAAPNIFTTDFMGRPTKAWAISASPARSSRSPIRSMAGIPTCRSAAASCGAAASDHTLEPEDFESAARPSGRAFAGRPAGFRPRTSATSFSTEDEQLAHDPAHGWPCGGGHLAFPVRLGGRSASSTCCIPTSTGNGPTGSGNAIGWASGGRQPDLPGAGPLRQQRPFRRPGCERLAQRAPSSTTA